MLSKLAKNLPEKRAELIIQIGFTTVLVVVGFLVIFGLGRISKIHESLVNIVNKEQSAVEILFHMQRISHDRSVSLYRISSTQDPFDLDEQIQHFNSLGNQFGQARKKSVEIGLDEAGHILLAQQKK